MICMVPSLIDGFEFKRACRISFGDTGDFLNLIVQSAGKGQGATFILEIPRLNGSTSYEE